ATGQDHPVAGHGKPLGTLGQAPFVDPEAAAVDHPHGPETEAEHTVEAQLVAGEPADAGGPAPARDHGGRAELQANGAAADHEQPAAEEDRDKNDEDRKSTRLNSR